MKTVLNFIDGCLLKLLTMTFCIYLPISIKMFHERNSATCLTSSHATFEYLSHNFLDKEIIMSIKKSFEFATT